MSRVLETVLTGRNLLSPVLAGAAQDVVAYNATVTQANKSAGITATQSARVQQVASTQVVAASGKAAEAVVAGSARQTTARRSVMQQVEALAAAEQASSAAVITANTRVSTAVSGTAATYQRSAASLREKLGLQALDGAAADRSAAANSRAAASAAVFSKAIDGNSTALARDAGAASGSTAATRANTTAREQATLAARAQQAATNSLAASNGLLGTSLTPLTAGLTAGALALAYAGYKGMEFGSAMSQVQAASQASAADMGRMKDAAIDAGAKTQYSAVEAAQGITEMSKAGVSARDILGGGLTGALNLAAAGQISVADAAETGATALSVFRLEGNQMSHVADLLAAGAGKAQGSVGDLSAALNQSALVASQTGLSIEDTAGALAMFASNGLIGSDAGTSFKTMLQALTPNSEAAAKAMDAIGFSAYDAQGKFVGMESVAAQLRTGLSGLTEEQRNTTLETIFGSDAVRAASVLYKEGATGVAQWAAKVDDAGYAQKQAAQLTDNLGGDLEKLGGAFDSLMTSIGGGVQGPLRFLTQMLTGLLTVGGDVFGFFASLPGPVQTTIIAVAAFAALHGPLDALFTRLAVGITSTVTGMGMATGATTALSVAAGTARIAVAGLVTAAAPLATIAVLAKAVNDVVQFTNAGDDATATVKNLNQAIRESEGNEARFVAVRNAVNDLKDELASYQQLLDDYNSHGVVYQTIIGQFQYDSDEIRDARESVQILKERIDELEDANARADISTQRLSRSFGLTGDEVIALADKYGIDLTGSVQETRRLFENFYSMEFGSKPTEATLQVRDAMDDAKTSVDEAKTAVDQFKLSLDILSGAHVSMIQVESAFQSAIAQSKGAMDDLGGSVLDVNGNLNLQSENGRTAADVLLGIRDSGNQLISTMIQQGATSEQVRAKDAELRQSFINSAIQMGISEEAAFALADQILGIPAERQTKIDADTAAANQKIADTQAAIDNMHGRDIEINVRAAGRFIVNPNGGLQEFGGPDPARDFVGKLPGYMRGGWTGPGPADQVAGVAHADEFVVPKHRVNAIGGPGAVASLVGMGADIGGPNSIDITQDTRPLEGAMNSLASAMENATPAAGVAGTGAVGGAWGSIWQFVKARIPEARINSTYRAGDPGYHGRGKAVDFGYGSGPGGAGSAGLASINRLLHDGIGANLAELIYDGIGDDRPDLKNGRPLVYSKATQKQHHNHVHAAVADTGGVMESGTAHLNLSGRPERTLSPQQTEAFDRWMSAPAAMPGYGSGAAGWGGGINYDRLAAALSGIAGRRTEISVDATGFNADLIARKVADAQRVEEFLSA